MFSIARISLIALLMLAPLAFGAVVPWAWGGLIVLTAAIFLMWAIGCVQAGEIRLCWSLSSLGLYLPAFAVLVLALLQLHFRWTLDPIGTRESILKLIAYIAIFFLTQHLFSDGPASGSQLPDYPITRLPDPHPGPITRLPNLHLKLSIAIALYAFAMAVFAIIQFFADPGMLYGVVKPRWGGYVFGPYVNHNHYAGLMEMLIPIPLVLSLTTLTHARERLVAAGAAAVMAGTVFLSGSRGGMLALLVEFIVLAVVLVKQRRDEARSGSREHCLGLELERRDLRCLG